MHGGNCAGDGLALLPDIKFCAIFEGYPGSSVLARCRTSGKSRGKTAHGNFLQHLHSIL
jgi:hypothetical protein